MHPLTSFVPRLLTFALQRRQNECSQGVFNCRRRRRRRRSFCSLSHPTAKVLAQGYFRADYMTERVHRHFPSVETFLVKMRKPSHLLARLVSQVVRTRTGRTTHRSFALAVGTITLCLLGHLQMQVQAMTLPTTTSKMPTESGMSGPINGRPNGGDSNQDESVHIEAQRIIDHPCFELKSETVCGSTEHIECRWCSHWCIESTKAACLLPEVTDVLPKEILEGFPTLMLIRGKYLNSTQTTAIEFEVPNGQTQKCAIIWESESEIRCIIEGVTSRVKIAPRFTFSLSLASGRVPIDWIPPDVSISIREDSPQGDSVLEESDWYDNLSLVEYLVGCLAVVGLSTSLVSLLYIKRKQARLLVKTVHRMVLMGRMKKTLIKKGLYAEYSNVRLQTKLGDGHFGEVYQAEVTTSEKVVLQVAIKQLKKGCDLANIKMFLSEGIRMSTFRHERILSPMAISIDAQRHLPSIILPIMANGDLCRYLRKNTVFPIIKLLTFALQIAEGMEYLSSINMVHGDLAARNCLLDESNQIRIGDFGLSRQLYRTDYVTISDIYRPIRWMAIECLASRKPRFTFKSDIWSFGVVLWEIFTLGSYPYEEFDNWDLVKHLETGYRLHRPLNCPTQVYALMDKCWSVNPAHRPCISKLKAQLQETRDAIMVEASGGTRSTELAHSSALLSNYTSLAERFVQSRRISSQSAISGRSEQSTASTVSTLTVSGHWA